MNSEQAKNRSINLTRSEGPGTGSAVVMRLLGNRFDRRRRCDNWGRCHFNFLLAGTLFLALGGIVSAAEWSLGFEPAEGYVEGESPAGGEVNVLGGSAVVVSGDAAEGDQFVRFVPNNAENGLILNLLPELSGGSDRTIRFAVRLDGQSSATRLVLSYGQTLGLTPQADGITLEIVGNPPLFVPVSGLSPGAWLPIEIRETASTGLWSLTVAGYPVASDLPSVDKSEALADVLIFSDGSVELDAVQVDLSPGDDADTESANDEELALDGLADDTDPTRDDSEAATVSSNSGAAAIADAIKLAAAGDVEGAIKAVAASIAHEPGTVEWYTEMGWRLSAVANVLMDTRKNRAAVAVGFSALENYRNAEALFDAGESDETRADTAYSSARLLEMVLVDDEEAYRDYARAEELDSRYRTPKKLLKRTGRDRDEIEVGSSTEAEGGRP